jgi:hypothetical protein
MNIVHYTNNGTIEVPIEIAEAIGAPILSCPECGQLHVSTGKPIDESELDQTAEQIYNNPDRKTPLEVIEPIYKFRQALVLRGLI